MKKLFALLCILPLAGCAQLESALNSTVGFIDAPATQQAVATIKSVSTAIVCDVSSASALALQVEAAASAQGAVPTTNIVYVSSNLICQQLSGTATGTVANVPAVTAVK